MICRVNVVLPDDSGPYISTTLPFGRPPIPRALSKPKEPVPIDGTSTVSLVPSFIIVPLPNWLSICLSALSSVCFFESDIVFSYSVCIYSIRSYNFFQVYINIIFSFVITKSK